MSEHGKCQWEAVMGEPCDEVAIVGIGQGGETWVCLPHFEESMASIRAVIDVAQEYGFGVER